MGNPPLVVAEMLNFDARRMDYCDSGLPAGDLQLAFYIILM